ncbi:hypothetical protein ACVPSA_18095 [Salmonella enterica subsp. enterica serovar Enteritidis]
MVVFTHAGSYTTTITRPLSFVRISMNNLYIGFMVRISGATLQHEIPYPYVIDGSELTIAQCRRWD